MKYRKFIEDNFMIDDAKTGELIPFRFNKVQAYYYKILCDEYDIETKGLSTPIREDILKARREGFTSLVLALFCADDILQENSTNTEVISYKDDATKAFRKRYMGFVVSAFKKLHGVSDERVIFEVNESSEKVFRHNKARFYCGTASAKTGGRGGVVHKQLFSEVAHYPDTDKMSASEVVEGGMRQVDIASGWVFKETTANGKGNFHHNSWMLEKQGLSRFRPRFFGWKEFYTQAEFAIISSEFSDPDMLRQEYPETEEEAFLSSGLNFTNEREVEALCTSESDKELIYWLEIKGTNYIDQCELLKPAIESVVALNRWHWLYAGIDVAKDIDRTVLTILRDKRRIDQDGGLRGLAIDSTGAGDFMPDWFEKNSRWYIHRTKFTRQMKDVMYKLLRTVLADKLTKIPTIRVNNVFTSEEAQHFWKDMLDLQKEVIGDMLVVHHPNGKYHDDYCDSWALAELVYSVLNGAPAIRKAPTAGSSVDSAVRRLLNIPMRDHSNSGPQTTYE